MKFEVFKTNAAQPYRFRIVASNGQVLAMSESYSSKASAKNACASIKRHSTVAQIVDRTNE